jgi:NhaA family Na+:H+ antiporter
MDRHPSHATLPPVQVAAEKFFSALERYLHVEAGSGIALIGAALVALIWANSPARSFYDAFWESPVTLQVGSLVVTQTLHFVINDGLMTVFFLVVGMEIRREMHDGALAEWRVAALPLAAAAGGVAVPALLYLALVDEPALRAGWAVPTATDIAFAVGVLALLGKSIPNSIRIFLLALAIVDDIAAILVIALFYSTGLEYTGFAIAAGGILLLLALQRVGVGSALVYVIPGSILWFGLLKAGLHPTLAGVALGLMTPVRAMRMREGPVDLARRALAELGDRQRSPKTARSDLLQSVNSLRTAQRELLPPVVRVQTTLHPWVAYGVMPLFALANAGVSIDGFNDGTGIGQSLAVAIVVALLLGKPFGILAASWLAVRLGLCRLPHDLPWSGVLVAGALGGIGFTMSIFIATLAFPEAELLAAAKLGVLVASLVAGIVGYALGRVYIRRMKSNRALDDDVATAPAPRPGV